MSGNERRGEAGAGHEVATAMAAAQDQHARAEEGVALPLLLMGTSNTASATPWIPRAGGLRSWHHRLGS